MPSKTILLSQRAGFPPFFNAWIIFHFIYTTSSLSIGADEHTWVSPGFGCCKYYCRERGWGQIHFQDSDFYPLWVNTQSVLVGSRGSSIFNFLEDPPHCFTLWNKELILIDILLCKPRCNQFDIPTLTAFHDKTTVIPVLQIRKSRLEQILLSSTLC